MTSQGSLHGQLQKAIERGNLLQATALARQLADELGGLSLSDALSLLLLFAEHDLERFRRAAPRWHARLVLEAGDLSLEEAQATLGALALLLGRSGQPRSICWGACPANTGCAWRSRRILSKGDDALVASGSLVHARGALDARAERC